MPQPAPIAAAPASPPARVLAFLLAGGNYALDVAAVERVLPALEFRPLPNAPRGVAGVFDLAGRLVPVIDTRCRLGLPPTAVQMDHQFIVVHTGRRSVALWVDQVAGIEAVGAGGFLEADACLSEQLTLRGVLRLRPGLTLLYDLERFITAEDERAIDLLPQMRAAS